MKVITGIGMRA